ncbi:MAG: phage baseplate assembly protein V [Spirochaetales bacterium]|jgi:type VI secretion system secreted protein VgrG|nr:phage baseplate assembly protein V [Spirochaetales bacterium]
MNSSELNNVQVDVIVDGKKCDYSQLVLEQTMSGHHIFEININYRPGKPTVWTETPETIYDQLGKNIGIRMKHRQSGETNDFRGVITDIDVVGHDGDQGQVVFKGGSPTLLLDRDPAMAVFLDNTLAGIISETIDGYGLKFEMENNPRFETTIPYTARYRETGYAFLSRLAASCGDWFFYDGKKLVVGNPRNQETRRVAYDLEIKSINISAGIYNLNNEIYDYNAVENDYFEDAPTRPIDGVNSYMGVARSKSKSIYKTICKQPIHRSILNERDVMRQMKMHHSRSASKLSNVTAEGKTCAIRLGEMVTIRLPKSHQKDVGPDLGRYRIIEITHRVNEAGIYSNTFKGVAGGTEMLPDHHVKLPTAFPEPAVVTDNADPLKMGRVKVRYFWQDLEESTNWMRLQGKNYGSIYVIKKNRGIVFIPEIDDQVMVAFEQGNPDRPFVSGSLFHRDNGSGAATDNNIKSITTRSGHTIEFDDTDGEEKINIRDNGGSIITFDTKEKSLIITSVENVDISGKNINLSAEENITLGAKKNLELAAEADVNTVAKGNVAVQSNGDTTLKSKGAFTADATADATVQGQNATVEGKQNADVKGGMQTNVSGTMAAVKGAAFQFELK